MKPPFFKFIFAVLLAIGLLVGSTMTVTAARAVPRYATVITLTKLASTDLATPFIVSGYFKTWFGSPVANTEVNFTINGKKLGQARTNKAGFFLRKFSNKFSAGTYKIGATTKATHFLLAANSVTSLEILPTEVLVQTIPALAGVTFNMHGQDFVTGPDGIAHIQIGTVGLYLLTVLPDRYSNPDQRIEFSRWLKDTYQPNQIVKVPASTAIPVGLNVYQKVGESFVDLSGFPVNPQRVTQFTIRSAQGDLFIFKDGEPRWIPASRIARFQNGLVATPLMYSVINLMVDGSNVINKAQQRFFAHPNDTWQISLILYSLSVRANDGLFGSSVGKSINLVYPDGSMLNFPFDKTGAVVIHSLARGNYTIQVLDDKGLKQIIPVALSRSQTVDIKVPTNIDLVILISTGLFLALGLLLIGRFQFRRPRSMSKNPSYLAAPNAPLTVENLQPVEEHANFGEDGLIGWN